MTEERNPGAGIQDPMTRRRVFQFAGVGAAALALPGLIAACGSSDTATTATTAATGTTGAAAAVPAFKGQIDYYGFEGEDFQGDKAFAAFLKSHDATVKTTYWTSPDDAIGKFAGGGGKGLDVILASSPMIPHFTEVGTVLQPLDVAKIPNLSLLLEPFTVQDGPWYFGGKLVAVPFSFSGFSPVWNGAKVKAPITTWTEMADPEYKNRLVLFGDPLASIMLVTEILKLGPQGKAPKDSMPKATEYVKRMVDNARSIAASPGDVVTAIQNGDADVCFGGFPTMAILAQMAGAKEAAFTMTPTDGNLLSVEMWGLGADADNADGAYAFFNEALTPKANAAMNNIVAGAPTVEGGEQYLTPTMAKAFPLSSISTLPKDYPYALPPPLESDEFITMPEWLEQWTAITGA
jgi:spermidine/putrescine-binding protein